MICKTIKQHQEELNNLKSKISDPIDCRTGRNNLSTFIVDTSFDSFMVDKFENSDIKIGKSRKVSLLKNAGEIMHNREADYLANSHLSIGNSAHKNESKMDASTIKKTMLLDTHRTTAIKDKHMCSIKPFEYKSTTVQNTSQIKLPDSNRSGSINREIVFENSCVKQSEVETHTVQLIKDAIKEQNERIIVQNQNDSGFPDEISIEQPILENQIVFEKQPFKETSYESPQKSVRNLIVKLL